jgi:aspartyl/asparaginyl beta-hydroxylase (cupin superfamily)
LARPAPFQSPEAYPELGPVHAAWKTIRAEALAALERMTPIRDDRSSPGTWKILPLLPEEEDRGVVPDEVCRQSRTLAPETIRIVESSIPNIKGYALSALRPGGHIRPHSHTNPYVTASLCLHGGNGCHLLVGGRRQAFQDGGLIVFDYTLTHEVLHCGHEARVVLLMLLDNRYV